MANLQNYLANLYPLIFIFSASFIVFTVLFYIFMAKQKREITDIDQMEFQKHRGFFLWRSYHSPDLQKLLHVNRFAELNRLLSQANWRSQYALLRYFFLRMLFVGSALYLIYYLIRHNFIANAFIILFSTLLLFYIAWKLPTLILQILKKRYQQKLRFGLSGLIELLVICFDTGYSIDKSLLLVAKTLARDHPEISNELIITTEDMRLQPARAQAWQNFTDRTDIPEIHSLIRTLQQHEQTGSPLAKSLQTQADYLRKSRMANAEKRAMRIPAFMSLTVGLFFFPIMIVIVVVPLAIYFSNLFSEIF